MVRYNLRGCQMFDFESLLSCPVESILFDETERLVQSMGYDYWAYTGRIVPGTSSQADWCFHNFNESMWADYLKCSMHDDAPIADFSKEELIPRAWVLDESSLAHSSGDVHADNLYRTVYENGVRGGVCIPIHDHANMMGTLTLASRTPTTAQCLTSGMGTALLFSKYLHKACVPNLRRSQSGGGAHLTPRELECLTWASKGKTTWEISRVLDISEHTVNFHLRNANSKLGATNRRQAVAKSIHLGFVLA
jgi:LuxR family transcriptional regulator, transcriptional activator of the bioluminescence operon